MWPVWGLALFIVTGCSASLPPHTRGSTRPIVAAIVLIVLYFLAGGTTMSEQPLLGTSAKVHGFACPNRDCSRYQGIYPCGVHCVDCGTRLKEAFASVAVFGWIDHAKPCGECTSYLPKTDVEGVCIEHPPAPHIGYPSVAKHQTCKDFIPSSLDIRGLFI